MPYLKDEKTKIQRFVSGFPLEFKDHIEYDEPQTLKEVIGKLKHCYEQSKHNSYPKWGWKGNDKTKGKRNNKRGRPWDVGNKENTKSYKKFNAVDIGNGSQPEEKNKRDGRKPLQCWTCGREHRKRDYPQHQGGKP